MLVYGLSDSRMAEIKESRQIAIRLMVIALFCLTCGTAVTLGGLKLLKYIMGVENFGFPLWTWLGIHFVIFWVGVLASIAFIALVLFFLALLANLDIVTNRNVSPRKPLTAGWVSAFEWLDRLVVTMSWVTLAILGRWVFHLIHPDGWFQMTVFIIACIASTWPWGVLWNDCYSGPFDRWFIRSTRL